MAVAFKTALGNGAGTSSGTTVTITTTAAIAIDDLVVVRWASDNLNATTPTATCADGGNTYTVQRQGAVNATAAAGVAGGILTTKATVARPSGSTITVTLSGAVAHKCATAESFTGAENTVRSTAVSATGASTAAVSPASGTVAVGDLVLGFVAWETRGALTGDADTGGGTWSTIVKHQSNTGGSDATCVSVAGQYKVPTSTTAQTFNIGGASAEWLIGVVVLQASPVPSITQAAYQWFGEGTEAGAAALAAQSTAVTGDITNGDATGTLRVRLQSTTAIAVPATDDFQLQYQKNGGTWTNVSAVTTNVSTYDSPNLTNGAATTNRLVNDVSRTFDGVDDVIDFAPSTLVGMTYGTVAALFKMDNTQTTFRSNVPIGLDTSTNTHVFGMRAYSVGGGSGWLSLFVDGNFLDTPWPTSTTTWRLVVLAKGTGSVAGTAWVYDFNTSTWTTNNVGFGSATPNAARTIAKLNIGHDWVDGTFLKGDVAAVAAWKNVALSDAQVKTLISSYGAWSATSPTVFKVLNQNPVATIVDRVDASSTQTSIVGTAVGSAAPIGASTGSFVAGKVSEDSLMDDLGWAGNNFTELVYALKVKAADVAGGDTLRFRVLKNGATSDMTYSVTPTISLIKTTAKLETLTDTFDTTLDLVKWPFSSGATAVSGGQAVIPVSGGYYNLATELVTAGTTYNIIGSWLYGKFTLPVMTGREFFLEIQKPQADLQSNRLYFRVYDNAGTITIETQRVSANNYLWSGATTYNPTNHAWLQIRESGGTIYFEGSPDGTTWSTIGSGPTSDMTWDLSSVGVRIAAGGTAGVNVLVDNINVPGGGASIGAHTYATAGGTSCTVATPVHAPGDLLVWFMGNNQGQSSPAYQVPDASAGTWVLAGQATANYGGYSPNGSVYLRTAGASEPSTFQCNSPAGSGGQNHSVAMVAVSGAAAAATAAADIEVLTGEHGLGPLNLPGVTVPTGGVALAFATSYPGFGNSEPPASGPWATLDNWDPGVSIRFTGTGTTPVCVIPYGGGDTAAALIALAPLPVGVVPNTGSATTTWNDAILVTSKREPKGVTTVAHAWTPSAVGAQPSVAPKTGSGVTSWTAAPAAAGVQPATLPTNGRALENGLVGRTNEAGAERYLENAAGPPNQASAVVAWSMSTSGGAAGLSYSAEVLADAPAGYWRLGESAGTTAVDSSGNGIHGLYTQTGFLTLGVPGLVAGDTAMETHGQSVEGVNVANPVALQLEGNFTVEAWIKTSAPGSGYRTVVAKQFAFGLFLLDGEFVTYEWGLTTTQHSYVNVADGQRHHLAVVFGASGEAGGSRFYVDGVWVGAAFAHQGAGQTTDFCIAYNTGAGQETPGVFDEVAIYPTKLTAERIAAHYAAPGVVPPSGGAVGERDPKGAGTTTWTMAPAAVGKRAPKATPVVTYTYNPLAVGKKAPLATATGNYTFIPAAVGKKTPKATANTGNYVEAVTAAGKKAPRSTITVAYTENPVGVGKKTPVGTANTANYTEALVVQGKRAPKATVTVAYTEVLAAIGARPVVGMKQGAATVAYAFTNTSVGKRAPKSTATASYTFNSVAAGKKIQRGTATTGWATSSAGAAPTLPVTSGLCGQYDASQLVLPDGTAVSSWTDMSGQGRHLTPVGTPDTAPTFKTDVLNGQPVVRFDALDDNLMTLTAYVPYQHFFVVAKYNQATFQSYDGLLGGIDWLVLTGNDTGVTWYPYEPANTTYHYNGTLAPGSWPAPMGEYAIMSVSRVTPWNFTLQVGQDRNVGGRVWDGDVAEVIAYDRALSDAERIQVEQYLNAKWFTSVTGGGAVGKRTPKSTVTVPAVQTLTSAGYRSPKGSATTGFFVYNLVAQGVRPVDTNQGSGITLWRESTTGGNPVSEPPPLDQDTVNYLAATGLDSSYATALDSLVVGLKDKGLWSKLAAIYPFIGGTEALHKWNLKDPRDLDAAYRLTFQQTHLSTHSGALGFRPNPPSVNQASLNNGGYADTHFVPLGSLDLNSTHLAYYSLAAVPPGDPTLTSNNGDRAEMGCYNWAGPGARFHIIARYLPGVFYYGQCEDGGSSTPVPSSSGLFVATRTAVNYQDAYRNGLPVGGNQMGSNSGLPPISVLIGGINGYAQRTDLPVGFASIGAGLSAQENADLYHVIQGYQTGLNRQVGDPVVLEGGSPATGIDGWAVGKRIPKGGNAIVNTWVLAAAGKKTQKGVAPAITWSEAVAAVGKRVARSVVTSAYVEAVAAVGKKTPRATGITAHSWTAAAVGTKPVVNMNQGASTVVHNWTPSAVGKRTPKASATVSYVEAISVSSAAIKRGAASLSWNYSFSSIQPSAAGLAVHLDASTLFPGPLAVWPNPGSGDDASVLGTPVPVVQGGTLNGMPCVRFKTDEGRIRMTGTGVGVDWTLVYVGRMVSGAGRVISGIYPPANMLVGYWNGFQDVMYDNGFAAPNTQTPVTPGVWKLYSGDGAGLVPSRLFSDGALMGEALTPQGWMGTFAISGYDGVSPAETCECEVAEVFLYDRKLSDTERKTVEDYLRSKWFGVGGAGGGAVGKRTPVSAVTTSVLQIPAATGYRSPKGTATTGFYTYNMVAQGVSPLLNTKQGSAFTSWRASTTGGAPGSSNPVTSGLGLALDASRLGLPAGANVTSWSDTSGVGRNATLVGGVAPTYDTTGGIPSVKFNGGDHRMSIAGLGTALAGKTAYTLFVRCWATDTSTYPIILSAPSNSIWNFIVEFNTDATVYWGAPNGWYRLYNTPVPRHNTWHTFSMVRDGAVHEFYGDGVAQTGAGSGPSGDISTNPIPAIGTDVLLGAYYNGGLGFNGLISDVVWYDRALSPAERQQVESYLAGARSAPSSDGWAIGKRTPKGYYPPPALGPVESLYPATVTVSAPSDPNTFMVGNRFTTTAAGTISAIRFWSNSPGVGSRYVGLWNDTGTLLADPRSANEVFGWNVVPISPTVVTTNQILRVAYGYAGSAAAGSFAFTGEAVPGSAHLTWLEGVYSTPVPAGGDDDYPANTIAPNNYFADVIFQSGGVAVPTWSANPSATGKKTQKATASTSYTYTAAAVGKKTPRATATTSYTYTQAAVGKRTPKGLATPANHLWMLTAQGMKTAFLLKQGSGLTFHTWAPAAVGKRTPKSVVTTTVAFSTAAVGKKFPMGAATTSYLWWIPTVVGKKFMYGAADPISYEWSLAVVSKKVTKGEGDTDYWFSQVAVGDNGIELFWNGAFGTALYYGDKAVLDWLLISE